MHLGEGAFGSSQNAEKLVPDRRAQLANGRCLKARHTNVEVGAIRRRESLPAELRPPGGVARRRCVLDRHRKHVRHDASFGSSAPLFLALGVRPVKVMLQERIKYVSAPADSRRKLPCCGLKCGTRAHTCSIAMRRRCPRPPALLSPVHRVTPHPSSKCILHLPDLVVGGDAATLQWVRDGLDDKDPATLTAVPVLVIAESGGAAAGVANGVSRLWPEEPSAPCSDGPLALTQLAPTH